MYTFISGAWRSDLASSESSPSWQNDPVPGGPIISIRESTDIVEYAVDKRYRPVDSIYRFNGVIIFIIVVIIVIIFIIICVIIVNVIATGLYLICIS